ncbi:HEAT repeat domain-containing protein [Paenibacillus sp. GYB006]|uniref:HEAT repeat domain-containing protein n=1 Tax=Paenibacillus sp. GYB006 TaxID=2994394 RepID=UPI002F96AEB1
MNEQQLLNLLNDMAGDGLVYIEEKGYSTSEGAPAWNATRAAEKLDNIALIPILSNLLLKAKKESEKQDIYYALGHLGVNTSDPRVVDILLKRLAVEKSKYTLECILSQIAQQKDVPDCTPILQFIDDPRWLVRHSAFQALSKCKCSAAEEALIQVITTSQDEYDLFYAIGSLCDLRATSSVPYLLPLLKHPKGEVRCSALSALDQLGDSTFLPVFIEALKDRSPAVKSFALLAIQNHGDETAIDSVYQRVKTMLKRMRSIKSDELVPAFEFLNRYREKYNHIQELFEWIISKKWDYLFDEEKDKVKKIVT